MSNTLAKLVSFSCFIAVLASTGCGEKSAQSNLSQVVHQTKCYEIRDRLRLPSVKVTSDEAWDIRGAAYEYDRVCLDISGGATHITFTTAERLGRQFGQFRVLQARCPLGLPVCKLLDGRRVYATFQTNVDLNDRPTDWFNMAFYESRRPAPQYFLTLVLKPTSTGLQPRR